MKWPWGITAKPQVGDWGKKPSTHAADRNSAPAVSMSTRTHTSSAPTEVLTLPPKLVRVPSAAGDEATPIFDSVMYDHEWDTLPVTRVVWDFRMDGPTVIHKAETMHLTNPPIDTQFEVAFILDLERQDMDADELEKWDDDLAYDAMEDVDFGWGDNLDFQPSPSRPTPIPLLPVDQWMTDRGLARPHA